MRLDQLACFQAELGKVCEEWTKLIDPNKDNHYYDQAYFLIQYSLQVSWRFFLRMRQVFGSRNFSPVGNLKVNLNRIASKIKEYEGEIKDSKGFGVFSVTDMIRMTVRVKETQDLKEVFQILEDINGVLVVKIDNQLSTDFQSVIVNFIYQNMIIAEVRIRYGSTPPDLYAAKWLRSLS